MASKSRTTWRSLYVNPPANIPQKQDELAGAKFDADSNKPSTLPKAPTLPLVLPPTKNLLTKLIKVFIQTTQAQAQALAELQKRPLKAKTPETYWSKSHIEYYQICQQCENYFKTSGATEMNRTPFTVSFLRGSISIR